MEDDMVDTIGLRLLPDNAAACVVKRMYDLHTELSGVDFDVIDFDGTSRVVLLALLQNLTVHLGRLDSELRDSEERL